MTLAAYALLICTLLGGGLRAGQTLDSANPGQKALTTLTLTNDRPTGSFPLSPATLAGAPPILTLTITKVINPEKTPVDIFVYLAPPSGEEGRYEGEKILLGNFGLYPADQPAGFVLRSSGAFRKLKARSRAVPSSGVGLFIEMKRIHPAKAWTQVELTVAPPQWRSEELSPAKE